MIPIRYLLLSIFFATFSVYPMTAYLHDKMAHQMTIPILKDAQNNAQKQMQTAVSNAQHGAIQKGLQWLDQSNISNKDKWTSRVFNVLNKNRPKLLNAMLSHYENRFKKPVGADIKSRLTQEFVRVASSDWTKVSDKTFSFLTSNSGEAIQSFISAVDEDIRVLNTDTVTNFLQALETKYLYTGYGARYLACQIEARRDSMLRSSEFLTMLDVVFTHFSKIDPDVIERFASPFQHSSIYFTSRLKNQSLSVPYVKNILAAYLGLNKSIDDSIFSYLHDNFQEFNSDDLLRFSGVASKAGLSLLTDKIVTNIDSIGVSALQGILENASHSSREKILDALKKRIIDWKYDQKNTCNVRFGIEYLDSILFKSNQASFIKKIRLVSLYNKYSVWYRSPLSHEIPLTDINLTQTQAHALQNASLIEQNFVDEIQSKSVREFIKKVHVQEEKEHQEGRLTFVHGCQWQWDIVQDVFTKLMEIKTGKKFEKYRFLRFEKDYEITVPEENIRIGLLKAGRIDQWRPKLLFMNHALFGNTGNSGSCTFSYWYNNLDLSQISFSMEDLFKTSGFESDYSKYKHEIEELKQLHEQAKNKGTLLLISIDPKEASDYIYPAAVSGYKKPVWLGYKEKENDVSYILNTLKNNPEKLERFALHSSNNLEYCMILTNDYALNPEKAGKDVKIYPFSLGQDTQEYKTYCTKRDALMSKIKRDLAPKADRQSSGLHLDFPS